MTTDAPTFDRWLRDAKIGRQRLTAAQLAVLEAGFRFLNRCGQDYYSLRFLGHFLLHCQTGLKVLETFRTRQHHEQGYRVGVHDEHLNAVPCGYDKQSPDRRRPRFHRGPLQMIGWLAALVYNAVADLADKLPERYHGAHVSTLRRTFFNQPGQLYLTPNTLIVQLDRFAQQEAITRLIDSMNQQSHRLPWLDDRRLVLSLTPPHQPRAGP